MSHPTIRIVAISDTHGRHARMKAALPDGDILIHAGDLCRKGTLAEVADFNRWIGQFPHPHKIVIAGNHDWCLEREPEAAEALLTNVTYLRDSLVEVAGLRIYGSPYQPVFHDWAFQLERGAPLEEKWSSIPENIDILVTHGPPYGIGDRTFTGKRAGDEALLARVQALAPRLHIFGHIHEAYGQWQAGETLFVNASIVNLRLSPKRDPFVTELALAAG